VPMAEPQVIRGLTENEYNKLPGIRHSTLKYMGLPTPAHAKHAIDNERENTDSLINGSCLHALVLEDRTIFEVALEHKNQKNPVQPEKLAGTGQYLLSPHNAGIIRGMREGVMRNPGCRAFIESLTERELTIVWDRWKARLDGVSPTGVVDLKSTKGANLRGFQKAIADFSYHTAAAHYLEAAANVGLPCDEFVFVAVENFAPYEAALYRLEYESLEIGGRLLDRYREEYLHCTETGIWPGYAAAAQGINLPNWYLRNEGE